MQVPNVNRTEYEVWHAVFIVFQ